MPFPVLAAPVALNLFTTVGAGLITADALNRDAARVREGFSNSSPSLSPSSEAQNLPTGIANTPSEKPVWDGTSTGTGALSDKLQNSRSQSLKDSYMPLVGAAPTGSATQAKGKSSSVPTPRANEQLRDKLAPKLGNASDLGTSAGVSSSASVATGGLPPLGNSNRFGFPSPNAQNSDETAKGISDLAQQYAQSLDAARVDSSPAKNPPPFVGGQTAGAQYRVYFNAVNAQGVTVEAGFTVVPGPITGATPFNYEPVTGCGIRVDHGNGTTTININCAFATNWSMRTIEYLGGGAENKDTGGDPPPLTPSSAPTLPAPYPSGGRSYGSPSIPSLGGDSGKMAGATAPSMPAIAPTPSTSPTPSSSNAPTPSTSPIPSSSKSSEGKKSLKTPDGVIPNMTKPSFTARPYVSGVSDPSEAYEPRDATSGLTRAEQEKEWQDANAKIQDNAKANERAAAANDAKKIKEQLANLSDTPQASLGGKSPQQIAREDYLKTIKDNPVRQDAFKEAPTPTKAPTGFTIPTIDPSAVLILGAIAAGTTTTTNLLNQVNAQTAPSALKDAAKNGACEALQSPPCTKGIEDRIGNPIASKLDAAQVARDANEAAQSAALTWIAANQAGQNGVLASILAKVVSIFDFLQKVWANEAINKAMAYITMITTIHNAAMLSRGLLDTLGSALDSGLQVFGIQIKDKEGNQLGISQVLGTSFQNLVKGIIGVDNYTALNNTWAQANRIYQSGINLLSNVQSIVDSASAVGELTSNRVGTLMNSLRASGTVRENAYGAQSPNVTRANAFMTKLENLEQGVSNFASITGNIVTVQQSVNELKANRTELDNALKDKPVGAELPENTPMKNATAIKKEQSIYTIGDFSVVKPPETP